MDSEKSFIDGITKVLSRDAKPSQEFDDRVMAAVRAEPAYRQLVVMRAEKVARRGAGQWLLAPRTFRLAPITAFAAAAALLLAIGLVTRSSFRRAPEPVNSAVVAALPAPAMRADTVRLIQFVFVARDAHKVTLVGDFNDWDSGATPLVAEGAQGVWTVSVPLAPGRHQYAFVIDGEKWQLDPNAPKAVEDGYGTPNSVVTVSSST